DLLPFHHRGESLEDGKARRPAFDAIGTARAVAHYVKAHFAVGAFLRVIDLAGRRLHTVNDHHELVHEAFDVAINVLLRRQGNRRIIDADRTFRNVVEKLTQNAHRLTDLFLTHHE